MSSFWALCLSLAATFLSVGSLSALAIRHRLEQRPRTLSELAVAETQLLQRFRITLWVCGSLFAVALYGFVIPALETYRDVTFIVWTAAFTGNLLVAIFPARGRYRQAHFLLAQAMAFSLLVMACLFSLSLPGPYNIVEGVIALLMGLLAALTLVDTRRFLLYELAFIYLSHSSIIVAIIGLG